MVSGTFFLFGASLLRIGTSSVAPIKTQMSGSWLGLRGQDVVGEKRTSASPDSVVAHGSFRFQFHSFAMLRLAKGKLKLTSIQGMRREFNGRYWVEYTNTYVFAVESSSRPLAATLHVALGWEYILLVPVYIGLWFITPTSSTIRRHTLALATCTGHEKVFPATPSSRATTTVNCGWHSINTLSNDLREAPLMVGRLVDDDDEGALNGPWASLITCGCPQSSLCIRLLRALLHGPWLIDLSIDLSTCRSMDGWLN